MFICWKQINKTTDAAVGTQKKTNVGVDKHLRSAAGVRPTDMITRDASCK